MHRRYQIDSFLLTSDVIFDAYWRWRLEFYKHPPDGCAVRCIYPEWLYHHWEEYQ